MKFKDGDIVVIREGEHVFMAMLCDSESCIDAEVLPNGWSMSDWPDAGATVPFDPQSDAWKVIGRVRLIEDEMPAHE